MLIGIAIILLQLLYACHCTDHELRPLLNVPRALLSENSDIAVDVGKIIQGAAKATRERKDTSEIKKRGLVVIDVQNDFMGDIAGTGTLSVFEDKDLQHKGNNAYLGIGATDFAQRVKAVVTEGVRPDKQYDFIVYTFDFHPKDHCSFWDSSARDVKFEDSAKQIDDPSFKRSIYLYTDPKNHCVLKNDIQYFWPDHCVQGTKGARLHDLVPQLKPKHQDMTIYVVNGESYTQSEFEKTNIDADLRKNMKDVFDHTAAASSRSREKLDVRRNVRVYNVYKGTNPNVDSYSAFYGFADAEKKQQYTTGLHEAIQKYEGKISPGKIQLDMIGIAYDVCVANTAIDAAELGYKVNILDYATASVTPENVEGLPFHEIKKALKQHKIRRIRSDGEKMKWFEERQE